MSAVTTHSNSFYTTLIRTEMYTETTLELVEESSSSNIGVFNG